VALIENGLILVLALWALMSFCFAVDVPRLNRILKRLNVFNTWVGWSLFNAPDPAVRPGVFYVEFRDVDPSGEATPWQPGASGFFWSWRSFLWNPELQIACVIHHVSKHIKYRVESAPQDTAALRGYVAVLKRHVRRVAPLASGVHREIRLVRRFGAGGGSDEVIGVFGDSHHDSGC
jgi:hypothetical protein